MGVKRQKQLLAPLTALVLAAQSTLVCGAPLGRDTAAGVNVQHLTAWPAVSVAELVSRASDAKRLAEAESPLVATARAETPAPAPARRKKSKKPRFRTAGTMKVEDLLASVPMTFGELLGRVEKGVPPGVPETLPDETKAPESALVSAAEPKATLAGKGVARVVIPPAPGDEPNAALAANRTGRVVVPSAPADEPQVTLAAKNVARVVIPGEPSGAGLKAAVSPRSVAHLENSEAKPPSLTLPAGLAVLAADPAPKAAAAKAAPLVLEIKETAKGLSFHPESLTFPLAGATATVRVQGDGLGGLSLFVRDQGVVELRHGRAELRARQKGVTELYAVVKGHMYILPISVAEGAEGGGDFDLKVPDALVSLDGVFQGTMQSALYPGLEGATAPAPAPARAAAPGTAGDATAPGQAASVAADAPEAPSLQDSVAQTTAALLRQAGQGSRYYTAKDHLGYKPVTIQVVDDRTDVAAGRIYPVAGAQVRLVGTEFGAVTDAAGHLTIRDVPQKSHFLVRLDDPSGQERPGMAELTTGSDGVTRLRMVRNFAFETDAAIAQTAQNAALGSYCATVVDKAGAEGTSLANVAVAIDAHAEGPFFYNAYGYMDRSLQATGPNGRFCYFNVASGPVAVTLYQDGAPVATMPVSLFAGRHVEERLPLGHESYLQTRLAAAGTAQEQLASDARSAGDYKPVDMIDLIPFGDESPMAQVAQGVVQTPDALVPYHGRHHAYAQAAEFEPAVYTYPDGDQQTVTPLLPRGFVEDLSLYAQVSHDPALGSVLAEYATPAGAEKETISMRLVDEAGRDVGDGWYFSDAPVTRAIFFNVPAGTYALLVETKDGYWLSSDTVMVYNETVSYMRLGSALRYRIP